HRLALVCRDAAEAAAALAGPDRAGVLSGVEPRGGRSPAFLFPGQGAQYPGMGGELYREEAAFGREIDRCAEVLAPALGLDLRAALYPADASSAAAGERLRQTDLAQASLFAVEYALARLWMSWGVVPQAMLGHSIGEYVAACLAEVFSLEDALALVAARGRLMRDLPAGAMLGVPLAESELAPLLAADPGLGLDLAAVNGVAECVVSGPPAAVAACRAELARRGIKARLLHTSRAFHSRAMDAIVEPFAREVERRPRQAPRIPFVSSLTGTWIRDEEATDPHYWARQLRQPVRFAAGLETLLAEPGRVLLEVGPGETLASLARRHPALAPRHAVVPALRHAAVAGDEQEVLAQAVARLWLVGVEVDPAAFYAGQRRRRLPLPTYPFERRRYWIDPPPRHPPATAAAAPDAAAPGAAVPSAPAPDAAAPPAPSRARLSTAYAAPRDSRESTIAALWQQRLGVEPVGIHDDFFELGGHSLLATRIAADVRRAFGTDLSLRELFATPTVAHLASAVAARQPNAAREPPADAPALPPLVPDPAAADQPFPLTDVQGAYWIGRGGAFELGGVGTHSYFEAEGAGIDLERFASSLRLLIARHGMLRAVMLPDGRQQVLPEVPAYEMAVLDLRDEPPATAERQLLAVRERMSHQVLPADRWPLFEVCATRLAGGRVRFHVSFDFLIGDAWSVQLLGDELARLYRDPAAVPPPPAATFRDYVLAAAAVAESDLFERSLDYWRRRLDTLPPPPDLPLAAPAGSLARVQFTRRSGRLEKAAWERLKDRAARSGLTASVAVLAAFGEALAAWSKGPRFTLNLTLFNRLPLHPEVDRIVGDFTSLTLLEIDAAAATAFVDRARRIQERLWDDLDHRYVSGVRVLRELGRRHRPQAAAAPVVFTSLLTLGRREAAGEAGPGALSLDGSFGVSQTPQVWLDHQVSEQAGG
ncbi:MAG TPA: acyltransferase domain-containing protein, partial [Thermoanaerobaculia bacterium]|nr:acyltransferase domain-containing protein [Thermoanaerobaculia bacterium]